jgi:hypothetical protein
VSGEPGRGAGTECCDGVFAFFGQQFAVGQAGVVIQSSVQVVVATGSTVGAFVLH